MFNLAFSLIKNNIWYINQSMTKMTHLQSIASGYLEQKEILDTL